MNNIVDKRSSVPYLPVVTKQSSYIPPLVIEKGMIHIIQYGKINFKLKNFYKEQSHVHATARLIKKVLSVRWTQGDR